MKRYFLPNSILFIFVFSLIYWIYLSLTTRMTIVFDSVGYQALGHLLYTNGWIDYFKTGPNREPLYPLLISFAMSFEHVTGLAYVRIMAFFGVCLMFLTEVLTYRILCLLNIRVGICVFVLAYLAVSPALNNAAFSLYSEIAALPIILGIVLMSAAVCRLTAQQRWRQALIYSGILGLLLAAACFVKAVFECISPAYLAVFFLFILILNKKKHNISILLLCLFSAAACFYVPVTTYKNLNKKYNGNFVLTDRGPWALYGNTARRMEPLTFKRLAQAVTYAPGEGVCESIFGYNECRFWSFWKSDELGLGKMNELAQLHLSSERMNSMLIRASAQKAAQNPFQYALLSTIEGLKMFFWESTKVGFVSYPEWLGKIYNFKLFNNGLRSLAFIFSFVAVVSMWRQALAPACQPILFIISLLIFLYILFFSFFFILTRYALPIAPLYLISAGCLINQKLKKADSQKHH